MCHVKDQHASILKGPCLGYATHGCTLSLALTLTFLLGCADGSAPEAQDGARGALDAIHVESDPVLSLGAVSGRPEIEFESLRQIVVTGDGDLAVLDAGPNEVRFFDPTGEFLESAGGVGEGPGELQSIAGRWVDEEGRVVVHDAAQQRLTAFSLDAGFVSSTVPRDPTGPETALVEIAGRVGDGWLVFLSDLLLGSPSPGEVLQHTATVALLGPEGDLVEGSSVELSSVRWYTSREGETVRLPLRYSPVPRAAVHRGATGVLDPERNRVLVPDSSGAWSEFPLPDRCGSIGGEYLDEVQGDGPLSAIPTEELAATEPECPVAWDVIEVTGDRRIWVRGTPVRPGSEGDGDREREWMVIDPADSTVRPAWLPEQFVPMDIDEGVLYGRWADTLGVHYVRAHRLLGSDR